MSIDTAFGLRSRHILDALYGESSPISKYVVVESFFKRTVCSDRWRVNIHCLVQAATAFFFESFQSSSWEEKHNSNLFNSRTHFTRCSESRNDNLVRIWGVCVCYCRTTLIESSKAQWAEQMKTNERFRTDRNGKSKSSKPNVDDNWKDSFPNSFDSNLFFGHFFLFLLFTLSIEWCQATNWKKSFDELCALAVRVTGEVETCVGTFALPKFCGNSFATGMR